MNQKLYSLNVFISEIPVIGLDALAEGGVTWPSTNRIKTGTQVHLAFSGFQKEWPMRLFRA